MAFKGARATVSSGGTQESRAIFKQGDWSIAPDACIWTERETSVGM